MNALSIHQLSVFYEHRPVLKEIDLEVQQGQLVGIIGPNGAGKSTFIKSILGLVPHTLGDVTILGESYKKTRKLVGYVPQRESVDWDFPTNALDVVLMGRYGHVGLFKRLSLQDRNIANAAL